LRQRPPPGIHDLRARKHPLTTDFHHRPTPPCKQGKAILPQNICRASYVSPRASRDGRERRNPVIATSTHREAKELRRRRRCDADEALDEASDETFRCSSRAALECSEDAPLQGDFCDPVSTVNADCESAAQARCTPRCVIPSARLLQLVALHLVNQAAPRGDPSATPG